MRQRCGGESNPDGGVVGYPLERIYEEVAFIAYHFHWSHDEIMQMPHDERKRWCQQVNRINRNINQESK